MAQKLKIFALGGLDEIGKNMYVYEYGKDILVVDCGMGFPDEDMYGIDVVIPDITYLVQNKDRVRGIVLTHGHEDHIGAMPYVMSKLDCPVYATRLTAGLVRLKLEEHRLADKVKLITHSAGDVFHVGCFTCELIHVNHSIPDSVAVAIKTPVGTVIHTGDFKIDLTPIEGGVFDFHRFAQLGEEGVLALLSDSTNVERPGYSDSEHHVGESMDKLFRGCDKRIIVTTFASNIHRIQQVIDCAARYKRKVGITGRSMENAVKLAVEEGYMTVPKDILVDINRLNGLPPSKVVIISTGSQGENMSALYRMAFFEHRQVKITAGDRVIISASAIPGNERTVTKVIDELFWKGAEVIYDRSMDIHVSGHACQQEQKIMMALTKPKFFIPVHGEHRMLCRHSELAQEMGIDQNHIVIAGIGEIIELTPKKVQKNGTVPSGRVLVDGTDEGGVGNIVLRDRQHLAQDGMLVVVMTMSTQDGSMISDPEIITRGFVYVKDNAQLMEEMRRVVYESIESCERQRITDWSEIKAKVKTQLSGYLYKVTRRSPMILPVIMEV
ncbi:MAG: ribonuclease J [Oscillospiraceae bacterium]|nr:ribonuclease J [Oscillospiraceae bacterium]